MINIYFILLSIYLTITILFVFSTRRKFIPYLKLLDKKKLFKIILKIFGFFLFLFLIRSDKTLESIIEYLVVFGLILCFLCVSMVFNSMEDKKWMQYLSVKQIRKMKLQRIKRKKIFLWK